MWVLVLSRFRAGWPLLQRELEDLGANGLITDSAIRAQGFLQNRLPTGVCPCVIVVAECDNDLDHWAIFLRRVVRPMRLLPVVLKPNQSIGEALREKGRKT